MDKLTDEQKEIIENSLWIVNDVLKKKSLQWDDDLRQSANFYLCLCLQRFDKSKGVKWETYAYKNILLYVRRSVGILWKAKQHEILNDVQSDETIHPVVEVEREILRKEQVEERFSIFNEAEQRFLRLKSEGYTYEEISGIINCKKSSLDRLMRDIKRKVNG